MISRHTVSQPPLPLGYPSGRQAEGVGSGDDMTSQHTATQPRPETEARNPQEVSTWMRYVVGWQAGRCAHPAAIVSTGGQDGPDCFINAEELRLLSNYLSEPASPDPWIFM